MPAEFQRGTTFIPPTLKLYDMTLLPVSVSMAQSRTEYMMGAAQCNIKMQGLLHSIIKNFKSTGVEL